MSKIPTNIIPGGTLEDLDRLEKHRLKTIHSGIIGRCTNKSYPNYPRYGGRGISICDEWLNSFESFARDMGPRENRHMTVERIDVNGNYCPENCRWASRHEQARNRRTNRFIEHKGQSLCATDWDRKMGLKDGTVNGRLRRGYSVEEAIENQKSLRRPKSPLLT